MLAISSRNSSACRGHEKVSGQHYPAEGCQRNLHQSSFEMLHSCCLP